MRRSEEKFFDLNANASKIDFNYSFINLMYTAQTYMQRFGTSRIINITSNTQRERAPLTFKSA